MCILFIAVKQHKDYPLIIAANRDEFHRRPTLASHFWEDTPNMLAGKDIEAGGSWMGVNTEGYISALTNVRDPQKVNPTARSRGELVTGFLKQPTATDTHLEQLHATKNQYNGYNLLFGHWQDLWVYNNHTQQSNKLSDGFYGLSNADLNSPWPKINQGVKALQQHCQTADKISPETLFSILLDQNQAADEMLPQTGVPIEWERKLSSIFIQSPEYGTRSSTLMLINKQNHLTWLEHSFNNEGQVSSKQNFEIAL